MKSMTAFLTTFFAACSFISTDRPHADNTQITLTVVKQDNQNPGYITKTDTIFEKNVDLSKIKIDVYFSHDQFEIPSYMPTKSIFRDSIKDKECNWKIYPATVKCYEYDTKNRVIKMQVEGSGTTRNQTFKYDDSGNIIEMADNISRNYKMSYDKNGYLLQITVDDGDIRKKLDFYYDKK